ncbi:HAD family hydrolase [Aliivibrio sp. S4TY2]|uniref:HAD family hydrolase n=1 Tax=unclassified Aliivibrio TaxID=2645654 RepID=UPI002377ECA7|nr:MULTISPECIES: HAD family hydrolase [unclassified Aliivibrio]MDD9158405.1 HAD family hydrolase [Aliivibrio sp. S4TY2]MDD9162405.1 HAD family hydrolase [Aliivibrio sp. S4TY1]MDD9166412.1 HAD family hydrolase [Aliivibrio sp. S4MY2]MDD9170410.1 HAD family hydrolase [Aliivibrio sp. S4MY4]MDD9187480.1 HAD family hydrolase [Aliivibrio sp. S4MY3]
MRKAYLFDWGDTLMVDFPNTPGKMCDWKTVQAVDGASEMLALLSQKGHLLYVATGADDSSVQDIELAFERVGLSQFISGYFCKSNLGLSKGSPEFYQGIADKLGVEPSQLTMVGDSLEKDIISAQEAGLNAVWFNPLGLGKESYSNFRTISQLHELSI